MFLWMLLSTLFICSSEGLLCNLKNMKISCNAIKEEDLYTEMLTRISPDDVLDLTIVNASIGSINGTTFSKYRYMHTLHMDNLQLQNIEKDTFANLSVLKNVYLSYNSLEYFNSNIFSISNTIDTLDISNNLIRSLDDFNATYFPTLTLLNISNNQLQTLPKELLNKLNQEEEFYIIIDDNPWDCSVDASWLKDMDVTLINAFCKDLEFVNIQLQGDDVQKVSDNPKVIDDVPKVGVFQEIPVQNEKYNNKEPVDKKNETNLVYLCNYETRCFSFCIFWFIGGIWLGIILGNACKIKSLICVPSVSFMQEQDTQYERVHLRSKE